MATTRTRQRSMKEFFAPAAFDQSPMKAARRAGRTHTGSSTNSASASQSQATTSTQVQDETDDVGEEESEDPILLSPRSKANGKGKQKRRSADESEDGERKRPKLELDGDDKEAAKAIFGGTRVQIQPSSTFPPAQTTERRPLGLRATSVPPDTSPPRVDLSKLVLGSPRRRRSPVRGALRYTSEPADVKDLDLDGVNLVGKCKEKEKEKLDTVAEAPATPAPGPRASMDALYKARKRMGSASPATPPQRPTDHAPPLDVVAEEPPVAHPALPEPATSSPPIPPATPDTGHGHAPPSYFNFESSPAPERPPSTNNNAHATNNSQITTPRDGPSRKRPRSPVAKSSPADRLASSVRASKLLDSLFSFDDAPTAIPSPKLTQSRTGGGSPALAKSASGNGAPVLSRSTSGDSERRDEMPSPAKEKDKSRAKRGKKDRPDKRAPSLVPSSRSSRSAKGKAGTSVDGPAAVQEEPQPKKPPSKSSAKSAHSRAPQLEPLVVDTQRAQPEAGPSSESPLTALPSENERIPSVPAEETTAPVPPENGSPSAHEEDVPLPAPVEEAMSSVQAEGEGDTTMVGGDDTFVVAAPAEVEVPAEVEQPVIAHEDIAPADEGVPATPMDEDPPPALEANTTLDAALDRARTQSPPADLSHPHEDAPLESDPPTSSSIPHEIEQLRDDAPRVSNTPIAPSPPPPPPAPVPEDTDLPMSDLTQPSSDAELTGLDDMSELTAQSEPEAEDAPVIVHEEVHARRGRGRGRGAAAAGRGRGRGAASSQVLRGGAPATRGTVRGSAPATATATRGRRGGIPRAAPSTSRLTRSSSTRTVDSTGTTVSRETTGKGKEKEKEKDVEATREREKLVEAPKEKEKEKGDGDDMDVEIVKDVGDAMDIDDGPSSSVRQRPKTPLKMTVELPAEGSKTPGRAKTPGPGPFVRPKTPGVSNAKSTGSDASSSNTAAPRRTGGFAAPTASSLSKTQASPAKKPAPSSSSPTKPASRPFLTSKASHSSLSNLNAVLERARASTSMGFSRDAPRPARTREDLPDRLDGSSLHANAKGKGKAGAKEKPKLAPGQTTLNGAGPSTLNGPSAAAAPLKRTASLGALGRGAPPGGGAMKQATLPFARPGAVPRAAGFPARRMLASQKSRLAPIKGSPVKGGAAPTFEIEMSDEEEGEPTGAVARDKGKGRALIAPMDFSKLGESAVADSDSDDGFSTLIGPATPASRVHAGWEKNASRRASLASENLLALQAQAQSPGTPPESARARSTRSGGAAPPTAAGVPRVLRQCSVYVDVRGPEGDDQGTWFVETLKLLGARVQTRLGSACTHIVFRGGGAGTLLRYTQLPEPKPAVVGVGWVVACAEEVRALEPGAFLVDVAAASAEALVREKSKPQPKAKKRKSTVPNFSVSPIAPGRTPAFVQENEDGDGLPRPGGSGRALEDEDITPLERARRRREAMEAGKAGK